MRAAIRNSLFGFNLAFTSDQTAPKFSPKDSDNVLIEVKAGAINPIDYKLPKAMAGPVLGIDFCGTIKEVGDKVTDFKVGDTVFGGATGGSLADLTVAKSTKICKMPSGWSATECAALPVAYASSLQGLRKGGIVPPKEDGMQSKESVLVIGASGGTGLAALQLCKAMGVPRIVAICSGKNKDLVESNGATEVVDYTDQDGLSSFFDKETGNFDCVYDVATSSGGGEDYVSISVPLLREGEGAGQYVALNGPPSGWLRYATGMEKLNQHIILADHNTKDQETILSLLDSLNAKPLVIEMDFTGEEVKKGYEMLHSRRTKGKIVFKVSS
jgi:NADPH:quinone reductase-like Zn-dependent oxidoreductase